MMLGGFAACRGMESAMRIDRLARMRFTMAEFFKPLWNPCIDRSPSLPCPPWLKAPRVEPRSAWSSGAATDRRVTEAISTGIDGAGKWSGRKMLKPDGGFKNLGAILSR